ncbi:MAG: hypothetical protein RLY49_543, partial [Candidatus Parcubacteria bacterium]|jgi:hypothetical protein
MTQTETELQDFIITSHSLREPSLLVVSDDSKLFLVIKESIFSDFKKTNKVSELSMLAEKGGKYYMIITKDNIKETYDFLKQYPLGAIDVFDSTLGTQKTYCPRYEDNTIFFIITKQVLEESEKRDLSILKVSGITKQII